jgi:hypothetical protein
MKNSIIPVFLLLSIAGCGGGGGAPVSLNQPGVTPDAPGITAELFNLNAAWKNYLLKNEKRQLVVSGDCNGKIDYTQVGLVQPTLTSEVIQNFSAFNNANLGGKYGLVTANLNIALSNCPDLSVDLTKNTYLDTNGNFIYGHRVNELYVGSAYTKSSIYEYETPFFLSQSVKVGDTANLGSMKVYNLYGFEKDPVAVGRIDVAYVIESNTMNSIIFNIISNEYDVYNTLKSKEQLRYKIETNQNMSLLSINKIHYGSMNKSWSAK